MNPSPFTAMAQQLSRPAFPSLPQPHKPTGPASSLTEQIRQLLRSHGSMNANHILLELDLPDDFAGNSGIVGALLKNDIAKGRVTRGDGKYHWNWHYDDALASELQQACQLLRSNGYTVREPK